MCLLISFNFRFVSLFNTWSTSIQLLPNWTVWRYLDVVLYVYLILFHYQPVYHVTRLFTFRCSHVTDIGVGYLSTMSSLLKLFLRWCTQIRDFGLQHGSIILMICVQIYTAMEPRLDIERLCILEETYIACVRVNVPP